jgi:hypothetical protein
LCKTRVDLSFFEEKRGGAVSFKEKTKRGRKRGKEVVLKRLRVPSEILGSPSFNDKSILS